MTSKPLLPEQVPPGAGPQSPPRDRSRARRGPRLLGVSAGAALVLGAALLVGLPRDTATGHPGGRAVPVEWRRVTVSATGLTQRVGVRVTSVAVTGGGGLVDLRFRVFDPDKAAAIHDPATPPAIVDEASGLLISQLFMGHAHSGPFAPAVTYYLIFENTANWVHHGSKVTVLLGDAQLEHVIVT